MPVTRNPDRETGSETVVVPDREECVPDRTSTVNGCAMLVIIVHDVGIAFSKQQHSARWQGRVSIFL